MNKVFEAEVQFNQASRPNWDHGAPHRERITRNLLDLAGTGQRRLCVFGAGNCNDLDLKQLREVYDEVHLVDLDPGALEYGVQFQEVADDPHVFRHEREVTGVSDMLARVYESDNVAESDLTELIERYSHPAELNLPDPFDVVCSTCILSQLILQAVNIVGEGHPQIEMLLAAIRSQHFQTVVDSIRPEGAGLIVSDFVSSESAADLKSVPDFQFTQYLSQLLSSHNFFHGVHPGLLFAQFQGDAPLAPLVQNVEMLPPWRWDLGARQYAVAGLRFFLRPEA